MNSQVDETYYDGLHDAEKKNRSRRCPRLWMIP